MAVKFLKDSSGKLCKDTVTGKPLIVDAAEKVEKYFDIEGTITTTTTSLVLENIPSNVSDVIVVLETRNNTAEGGVGKLTQIGMHSTRTSALPATIPFMAYKQAYTSVVTVTAKYDSETQTLTLPISSVAKNLQYRYFVKLY